MNCHLPSIADKLLPLALRQHALFISGGGGVALQVDTFAAERYSPHQIKRHNSNLINLLGFVLDLSG
jgi:hypothetical protein